MIVTREKPGRYTIQPDPSDPREIWRVWRGMNDRWYGESAAFPDFMVDSPTLRGAKSDIENRSFVPCAGAGDAGSLSAWETAMGMRGYAGSPAQAEDIRKDA